MRQEYLEEEVAGQKPRLGAPRHEGDIEAAQASRPKVIKAVVLVAASVAAVGFGLAGFASLTGFGGLTTGVQENYETLVKAGYPTSLSHFKVPVKPGQINSAPFFAEAVLLKGGALTSRQATQNWEGVTPTDREWSQLKAENSRWISLMEMGARGHVYSPERTGDFVLDVAFSDLADIKLGARFFASDAVFLAQKGQDAEAWMRLGQSVKLGELVYQEGTLISGLVSLSVFGIALDRSQALATHWRNKPDDLSRLERTISQFSLPENIVRQSLKAEFLFGLDTARNIRLMHLRTNGAEGQALSSGDADRRLIRRDGPPQGLLEQISAAPVFRFHVEAMKLARNSSLSPGELSRRLEQLAVKSKSGNILSDKVLKATTPGFSGTGEAIERAQAQKAAFSAYIDLLIKTPSGMPFPKALTNIPLNREGRPLFTYERFGQGFVLTPAGLLWTDSQMRKPLNERPGVLRFPRTYDRSVFE